MTFVTFTPPSIILTLFYYKIQDSVVLPNMDDIPFFDTSDCTVRGGIFADATRPEWTTNFGDPEHPGKLTRSSPQKSPSLSHTEVGEKPARIGGLVLTGVDRADTATSLPSLALDEEAEPLATSSNPNRRSAWFMSPKKDLRPRREPASDAGPNVADVPLDGVSEPSSLGIPTPSASDHGIPYSDDRTTPVNGTPDERSPPISEESAVTPTPGISVSSDAPSSSPLSAAGVIGNGSEGKRLRSPSAQSHKSTMSSDVSSWLSSRTSTGMGSDGSEDDRPNANKTSAASTLIANWKTKAAEKQLGATARETMKKWGWGTGSKIRGSGPGSDHSKGSTTPPKPTLPKQTYAEMRAQVEERRQTELSQRTQASANHSSNALPASSSQSAECIPSSPPPESGTPPTAGTLEAPVEISGEPIGPRKRTLSSSSSLIRRNSNASSNGCTGGVSPVASPHLHATADATPRALSHISPSLPKTTTEVSHLSLTSMPSLPPSSSSTPSLAPSDSAKRRSSTSSDPSLPDVDPSVRARTLSSRSTSVTAPVFVAQPSSAAMMAIPAIHASRRGEIMALGSSPPPAIPQPASESPTMVPRLGASIQNVYRMFNKNSVIGSNKSGVVSEPSPAGVTAASSSGGLPTSERAPSPGSTTEDADQPTANRKPPPLPPRKSTKDLFVQDSGRTNTSEATAREQTGPSEERNASVPVASLIPAAGRTTNLENAIMAESLLSESIDGAAHARPSDAAPDGDAVDKGSDGARSTMMSYLAPERPAVKLAPEDDQHSPPSEAEIPPADPPANLVTGRTPSLASAKKTPPLLPPR
jgi:hypothetical protein